MRSSTQSSVNSTQTTYRRFYKYLSSKATPCRSREWTAIEGMMRNNIYCKNLQEKVSFLKAAMGDLEDVEPEPHFLAMDEKMGASKRRLNEATDILEKETLKRNDNTKRKMLEYTNRYQTKFRRRLPTPQLLQSSNAPIAPSIPPKRLELTPQPNTHRRLSKSLLVQRHSMKIRVVQDQFKHHMRTQTNFSPSPSPIIAPLRQLVCRNPESVFKFQPPKLPQRIPIQNHRKSQTKYAVKITSKLAWMFDHRKRLQIVNLREGRKGDQLAILPWGSFLQ